MKSDLHIYIDSDIAELFKLRYGNSRSRIIEDFVKQLLIDDIQMDTIDLEQKRKDALLAKERVNIELAKIETEIANMQKKKEQEKHQELEVDRCLICYTPLVAGIKPIYGCHPRCFLNADREKRNKLKKQAENPI